MYGNTMSSTCARSLITLAKDSETEICGFIMSDWSFCQVTNVADRPKTSFFMDTQESLAIQRTCHDEIIGIYHSHPGGNPYPSQHDLDGWNPKMPWRYFIIAGNFIREFKRRGNDITDVKWCWPS